MPLVPRGRACGRRRTSPRTAACRRSGWRVAALDPSSRLARIASDPQRAGAGADGEPPRPLPGGSPGRLQRRSSSAGGTLSEGSGVPTARPGSIGGLLSRSPQAAPIRLERRRSRPRRRPPRTSVRGPSRPARPASASAARASASSQPTTRSAIASTARSSTGKDSSSPAAGGTPAASASLTSASPEWAALIGKRPAGGRLRGDHPEGLREGARHDERLARGQQLGELLVLEPAGEHDALGERGRGRAGSARAARPAGRRGTRAGAAGAAARRRACSSGAPRQRDLPRLPEVAGGERARRALEPAR